MRRRFPALYGMAAWSAALTLWVGFLAPCQGIQAAAAEKKPAEKKQTSPSRPAQSDAKTALPPAATAAIQLPNSHPPKPSDAEEEVPAFTLTRLSAATDLEKNGSEELAIFDLDGRLHFFGWNGKTMERQWVDETPVLGERPVFIQGVKIKNDSKPYLLIVGDSGRAGLYFYEDHEIKALCSNCLKTFDLPERSLMAVTDDARPGRFSLNELSLQPIADKRSVQYDFRTSAFKNGGFRENYPGILDLQGEPVALFSFPDTTYPDNPIALVSQPAGKPPRIARLNVSEEGVWEETILSPDPAFSPAKILWAQNLKAGPKSGRSRLAVLAWDQNEGLSPSSPGGQTRLSILAPAKSNLLNLVGERTTPDYLWFAAADLNGDGWSEIVGYSAEGFFDVLSQNAFKTYVDGVLLSVDKMPEPLRRQGEILMPLKSILSEKEIPRPTKADVLPLVRIGHLILTFDYRKLALRPAGKGAPKNASIPLVKSENEYYYDPATAARVLGCQMDYDLPRNRLDIRFIVKERP